MFRLFSAIFIFFTVAYISQTSAAHTCPNFTTQANAELTWPQKMTNNPQPDGSWWIYQEFSKNGSPDRTSVSAWLIRVSEYENKSLAGNLYGKGMIAIEEAYFTNTEGKIIKVLSGLHPAQMYVPYPNWDVLLEVNPWASLSPMSVDRITWECSQLGPDFVDDGATRPIFIKELTDYGLTEVVYDDGNPGDIWRRGTELVLRGVADTGNYDILVEYHFRDNGQILAQTGSTGYNNKVVPSPEAARTNHIHSVLWRIKTSIGDETLDDDRIYRVTVDQRTNANAPYNESYSKELITTETSEQWHMDKHTSYLFEDDTFSDIVSPNMKMGYALKIKSDGLARHRHNQWTNDFVIENDVMVMKYKESENSFSSTNQLTGFVDNEDISNGGGVFHVFTSVKHLPRNEDFVVPVKETYPLDRDDSHWRGVFEPNYTRNRTEPMWQGVILTPRNIHKATPFSKNNPNDPIVIDRETIWDRINQDSNPHNNLMINEKNLL